MCAFAIVSIVYSARDEIRVVHEVLTASFWGGVVFGVTLQLQKMFRRF